MLSTMQKSPVMKTGGKMKNLVDEVSSAQSAFISDNTENLCSSDGVFDFHPCPGNLSVCRFLPFGEFASFGLLHGLDNRSVFWCISLITGVLPKDAFIWKRILRVGNLLVVHLSFHGKAGEEYESRHTGDYGILHGVFLLFSTVILTLRLMVGRPWYFTFGAVMDELVDDRGASALVKQTLECGNVLRRENAGFFHGHGKHLGEYVYPLPALLLRHAVSCRKILLRGIVLEVDKDEEQAFLHCGQRTVGLYDMAALARTLLALYIMPSEVLVMGIGEKWQNFVKKSCADTGQCHKCGRIGAEFCVIHTLYNEISSRVRA